jgi:hypothetical protein
MNDYLAAAIQLHQHMMRCHWDGHAIVGSDPIGRINWRITRFVRSYLSFMPWRDQYTFLQGQGYWIKSNIRLAALTGDATYLEIGRQSADHVVQIQRPDGAWNYPNLRERRHLICSVEGLWASLGLLAAYHQFGHMPYLEAAREWYSFQVNEIGFVTYKDGLVPNFFDRPGRMVANAGTLLLWFVAELCQATGDDQYMKNVDGVVRFLQYSQMTNGELEYHFQARPHFMCYQYNSFEFLDLAHYYKLTDDGRVRQMLSKMAVYLATGVTERGSSRYNCFKEVPEVNYWTAALAAALHKAHELGLGDYLALSERAYRHLLTRQGPDGGFGFSERTYGLLRDTRSYPRYQAMILDHLLYRAQAETDDIMPATAPPQLEVASSLTQRES